jgi:CdiI immunity protein
VWWMSSELSHNLNDELPDGRPVKRFYALQDFFLGYLHPDWILDDPTTDSVLKRFAKERPEAIPEVLDEISELSALDVPDETLRAHLFERYDLRYDPSGDGLTMRQWLRHAQILLRSGKT